MFTVFYSYVIMENIIYYYEITNFEYKRYQWIFMYWRYLIFCTMKLWENATKNKNFNFISIFFGFFGGGGWMSCDVIRGGASTFVTPSDPEGGGGQK